MGTILVLLFYPFVVHDVAMGYFIGLRIIFLKFRELRREVVARNTTAAQLLL